MTESFHHLPVMVDEITKVFETVPSGVVLDATLGGGGHAERLLDSYERLRILGLDRDEVALAAASQRLARFGDRLMVHHCRFDRLEDAMEAFSVDSLSGAVFDLGVSSPQLDEADRGFSYRLDAALDMRMDRTQAWTAADVVNGYPVEQLTRVLQQYGDERFARRIANAIVAIAPDRDHDRARRDRRRCHPCAGPPHRRAPGEAHLPGDSDRGQRRARRVGAGHRRGHRQHQDGGRIAVLSYHCGEDRIVKERMRLAVTGGCECPPELPCVCDAVQTVRIVRGMPRTPNAAEQADNRRAASARLRVVERIADTPRRGTVG